MHVVDRIDRHTNATDFTTRAWRIRIDAHLGGQIERDGQTGLPRLQQQSKALVGRARRAEARILAHRPEPTAVHRGLHAAREGELTGVGQVTRVVNSGVVRTDDAGDRNTGGG